MALQGAVELMEVDDHTVTPSRPISQQRCTAKQHLRLKGKYTRDYISIPQPSFSLPDPHTAAIRELESVVARLELEQSTLKAQPNTLEEKREKLDKLRERVKVLEGTLPMARTTLLSYLC